jgi:DNA excision repair protein ERCC-4
MQRMFIADSTETRSQIPKMLEALNIKTEFMHLDVGDYIVTGPTRSVCFSSKSAEDYLGSIVNDHLSSELYQISSNYDRAILIVHGSIESALIYRKLKRQIYANYLAGCVVRETDAGKKSPVSVLNFHSIFDAVQFMATVHNLVTNDDILRKPTALRVKFSEEKKRQLSIQYMLKPAGVGPKKASSILEKFKTIKAVANASTDEFLEIDGIGKKIATAIYDLVNTESKKEE